jgi:hypothetical protein
MRSQLSFERPDEVKRCLSIPYLVIGILLLGYKMTEGISWFSASWRVWLIHISTTLVEIGYVVDLNFISGCIAMLTGDFESDYTTG